MMSNTVNIIFPFSREKQVVLNIKNTLFSQKEWTVENKLQFYYLVYENHYRENI